MKSKKRLFMLIPMFIFLLLALGFLCYDLIMSMVNYKLRYGVFNSPFVGLKNYEQLFDSYQFGTALGNSLGHTFVTLILTVPGAMLVSFLLSLIPSRAVKAALAGGALLLALTPDQMWINAAQGIMKGFAQTTYEVGLDVGRELQYSYWPTYILSIIVPRTAMCVFAGLALHLSSRLPAVLGVLLAGLVPLLTIALPDMNVTYLAQNAMNMQQAETVSTYAFKTGLMNAQYSFSGAITTFGKFVSLIPAIGFALAMGFIAAGSAKRPRLPRKGWAFEGLGALIGGLIISIAVVLCLIIGKSIAVEETIARGLANTVVVALIAAIVGFGFCTFLVFTCRRMDNRFLSVLMFMVIALSLTHMSKFSIGKYIMVKDLGILNTVIPVAFSALSHPMFLTFVIVLIALRPETTRQTLMVAAGGGLMAAATASGEVLGAITYVMDHSKFPLSLMLRNLSMGYMGSTDLMSGEMSAVDAMARQAAASNGAMVLMVGACLVFGLLGITLLMSGIGGTYVEKKKKQLSA